MINEVAGKYVCIGGSREVYLQDTKELLTSKDWEAGGDFLERATKISWWGWEEGSVLIFWKWLKEFRGSIRDVQKQWQVVPWPQFLHTWRV